MAGLLDDWRKSQYLQMAEEKLQGLLNIPTEAQRFITNPQAFMGLLGRNELPRETGFAAGATGLPPKNVEPGGVLNPKAEPYTKGYEQGEPLSYAAMALPMAAPVGKALAPKAYNMLEDYMVRTGGIIPLEAWHGTPHEIKGKFDISKVGTGEGAQAYGHGMYFAEAPSVAESYKTKLSGGLGSASNELLIDGQPLTNLSDAQRRAYEIVARDGRKNALGTAKDLESEGFDASHIREALKATKGKDISLVKNEGNLYKVDIPDEYIPNMLDWDKPLSEQPKAVQKALAKIDPDLYSPKGMDYEPTELGQTIYQRLQNVSGKQSALFKQRDELLNKYMIDGKSMSEAVKSMPSNDRLKFSEIAQSIDNLKNSPKEVSELLNQYGIKGINYLDAGSRNKGGTSNFVVFDPSEVKILEKNKKKVGLLD